MENLKNELTVGKELAKQLHLIHHTNIPSSSNETRELLMNKILNSYDRAIHMLHAAGETAFIQQPPHVSAGETTFLQPLLTAGGITGGTLLMSSESPRSLSISPRSEDSDHHRDFNTLHHKKSIEKPKKSRKNMPRWTKHVHVSPGSGLEGPLDDEYSWRKYGQKDILGAKYPRGYYRCTLRHVYGCMATKQVQRTDDDQTIFEITYRGIHTCNQNPDFKPPSTSTSTSTAAVINPDPATSSGMTGYHNSSTPLQQKSLLLDNFPTGLKVRTENLEEEDIEFHDQEYHTFDSLNFSTAATSGFGNYPIYGGSCSSMVTEIEFGGNPCPSLMSPATSRSSYQFGTTTIIGNNHNNSYPSESGDQTITGMVSAATSSTTSPRMIGVNFPIDQTEFAPDFTFDNLESFS